MFVVAIESRDLEILMLINNTMRCLGAGRRDTLCSFTLDGRHQLDLGRVACVCVFDLSLALHSTRLALFSKTCCYISIPMLRQQVTGLSILP
jgi:hypothetical protein